MTDLRLSGWYSAKDRLPDGECLAIQQIGKRRLVIVAFYAKKFEIESTPDEDPDYLDYDEKADCFYLPEGWNERVFNLEYYCTPIIDGEITHWQPLPNIKEECHD